MPVNLYYSRSIQQPDVAASFRWRGSQSEIGLLSVKDSKTEFLVADATGSYIGSISDLNGDAVANNSQLARSWFKLNANDGVGLFISDKKAGEYHNRVASLDGQMILNKSYQLTWLSAFSSTSLPDNAFDVGEEGKGHLVYLDLQKNSRDWFWYTRYREISDKFRADLGFINRSDWKSLAAGIQRNWLYQESDWLIERNVGLDIFKATDFAGLLLEQTNQLYWQLEGQDQAEVNVSLFDQKRRYNDILYNQNLLELSLSKRFSKNFEAGINFLYGDQIDYHNNRPGTTHEMSINMDWDISESLRLETQVRHWIFDVEQQHLFKATGVDIRSYYYFSNDFYLRYIAQFRDIDRNAALYWQPDTISDESRIDQQFLIAYRPGVKTLLYFGYSSNDFSESSFVDDYQEVNESIFLKISVALGSGQAYF
jgi:hypothetical protein